MLSLIVYHATYPFAPLVVEQPDRLLDELDAQLISRLLDRVIVLATQRRSNILDARPGSTEDIVDERELESKSARTFGTTKMLKGWNSQKHHCYKQPHSTCPTTRPSPPQ